MKRTFSTAFLVAAWLIVGLAAPRAGSRSAELHPPVTIEGNKDVSIWFGRLKRTGQWCAFDWPGIELRSKRNELIPGAFGWARYAAPRLRSVTFVQESEDAYVEDRYFVGPTNEITRLVRTGHYIEDPWVSLTFEPDPDGRLRLSHSSKKMLQRMTAANQETYFADWTHFSRLTQIPFVSLLDPNLTARC